MTLEQKDTDLDRLFSEALGMKRSAVVKRITLIKLMAWEQVLLIATYARKQYEYEQTSFHGRMGFIALLNDSAFKTLRPHLLPLIDGGMGLFSIIGFLKENLQLWGVEKSLYDYFIKEIENRGEFFTARSSPYLYSHYDLFIALTRFISICQAMLSLGSPQKICDDLTEAKLRQVFARKMQPHQDLLGLENPDEPVSLETLLRWQKEEPKDVSDFTMFIDTSIATDMQNIFINFSHTQGSNAGHQHFFCVDEKKIKFPDWVQQHVDLEKNQYNLCLDITTLNRFLLMGQHEEIGKMLGGVLHEAVKDQLKLPQSHTPSNVNASPAEWQKKCTVLELIRLDEVPPRIAAILYFDVRYMHTLAYTARFELNVIFDQPNKPEQTEMITTYIIRHCLFNQGRPSDFHGNVLRRFSFETFKDITKPSSNPLADPMMVTWANDTLSTVRSRFKKPLREFKKGLNEIDKLVLDQMSKALEHPYPLQAGFPAPLWLPLTIQAINES